MSLSDYFCDWKVDATIQTKTQTQDSNGQMVDSYAGTEVIKGVLHTANTTERYFAQNWASDVTKIFKTDTISDLTNDKYLMIDGIRYAVDGINNINEQGGTYVIGLKVHL